MPKIPRTEAMRSAARRWRKNHPGYYAEAQRKWRKTSYGRAFNLVRAASYRCRKKKLPFNLTPEDILPQLELGVCEVTGIIALAGQYTQVRSPLVNGERQVTVALSI